MPLNKHYKGHGEKVMSNMIKEYGPDKAKRVFYATENMRKKKRRRKVRKAIKPNSRSSSGK